MNWFLGIALLSVGTSFGFLISSLLTIAKRSNPPDALYDDLGEIADPRHIWTPFEFDKRVRPIR